MRIEEVIVKNLICLFLLILDGNQLCFGRKLWTSENKTAEETNTAYYCAQKDLRNTTTFDTVYSMRTFKALLEHMKFPNLKVPTIHVTGTNGKGSVVRKIGASMIQAGYRVGEYTSPGMLTEREDIRLNGKIISQGDYVKYHQICMYKLRQIYRKGGYYKLSTNQVIYYFLLGRVTSIELPQIKIYQPQLYFCMALKYFTYKRVDIIIVEVFMGGTKDHTNVLNPEVSIITNVARDHCQWLSNDTNKILEEKAGIIKENKPVIFGYDMNRTLAKELALKSSSPYYFIYPNDMNNFTFDHLNAKIARKAINIINHKFKKLKEKHLNVGLKAKLMARLEEIKPERLAQLAEQWNLPKLPHRVYNEFKTNFMSIKRVIKEMRQKHSNMTLRVVFSMSRKKEEAEDRIQYILDNVDYLHLIQTKRTMAVPLDEFSVEEIVKNESSKIDQSKFSFTREEVIDGVNSIDLTIKEAFQASSLRTEDEILLIWGVFWSSIKLLNENYEVDIPPLLIPTYEECKELLILPSIYKYSQLHRGNK